MIIVITLFTVVGAAILALVTAQLLLLKGVCK